MLRENPGGRVPVAEVVFGRLGNSGPCLLHGFSDPEDGFTWSVGRASALQVPLTAGTAGPLALELDVTPFAVPGEAARQRLSVSVNGVLVGDEVIDGTGTLGYRVPASAVAGGALLIELQHPQARRPVDLALNPDTRRLGFMVRSVVVRRAEAELPFDPILLPPLDLQETETEALKQAVSRHVGMSAAELVLHFESLGHNCEFGVMQRHCGAEPLGLLRFVGITLPDVLRGLDCGFSEVGHDRWLRVFLHPGARREFLISDVRHGFTFHSFRFEDETTAERVRAEQGQQLRFFHRKFMEVLQSGERLFVFQRPGQVTLSQMRPLLDSLRHYGPNALLFVTEGGGAPGSVERMGDGLYRGSIGRMAPGDDVGDSELGSWLSICANALRLWRP